MNSKVTDIDIGLSTARDYWQDLSALDFLLDVMTIRQEHLPDASQLRDFFHGHVVSHGH